jgi:hypothetical protein
MHAPRARARARLEPRSRDPLTRRAARAPRPGLEVGHYAGCVRAWRALTDLAPGAVPARAERGIAALEGLVAEYPLYSPQVRMGSSARGGLCKRETYMGWQLRARAARGPAAAAGPLRAGRCARRALAPHARPGAGAAAPAKRVLSAPRLSRCAI